MSHTDVEAGAKAGSSSFCPFGTFWYILFCERWEQGSRPTLSLTVSWLAISNWQEWGWRSCQCGCWFRFLWNIKCHVKKKTKQNFTHGYGIQARDAGRVYGFLSRCIPPAPAQTWNWFPSPWKLSLEVSLHFTYRQGSCLCKPTPVQSAHNSGSEGS